MTESHVPNVFKWYWDKERNEVQLWSSILSSRYSIAWVGISVADLCSAFNVIPPEHKPKLNWSKNKVFKELEQPYTWNEAMEKVVQMTPELQKNGIRCLTYDPKDIGNMLAALPVEYWPQASNDHIAFGDTSKENDSLKDQILILQLELRTTREELEALKVEHLKLEERICSQREANAGLQRAHDHWKAEATRKNDERQYRIAAETRVKIAEDSLKAEVAFRNTVSNELKSKVRSLEETNQALTQRLEHLVTLIQLGIKT